MATLVRRELVERIKFEIIIRERALATTTLIALVVGPLFVTIAVTVVVSIVKFSLLILLWNCSFIERVIRLYV